MGLADVIVDIVDTGSTLRANGLEPVDLIADVSSRLVVNKASLRSKHAAIQGVTAALAAVV
jgi:ATP phosphoribosyltransferase